MSKSKQHLQALPGHFRLNAMGITAFVLRYRVGPKYHHSVELGDAQRAIRTVRARAQEFRVVPDKIGILGFSAGGHLASTAETRFDAGNAKSIDPIDRVSSRLDFAVLCPSDFVCDRVCTSMVVGKPARKGCESGIAAKPIERDTGYEGDATNIPVEHQHRYGRATENSVAFYLALHKAGVPAELHIFCRCAAWGRVVLTGSIGGRVGDAVEELVEREGF